MVAQQAIVETNGIDPPDKQFYIEQRTAVVRCGFDECLER
jgi:hypothetical protein